MALSEQEMNRALKLIGNRKGTNFSSLPESANSRFAGAGQDIKDAAVGAGQDLLQRGRNIFEAGKADILGQQTSQETRGQILGNAIGAVGDLGFRATQAVTTPFLKEEEEKAIADTASSAMQATGIPEVVANTSERTQRNITGSLGILEGATAGVAGLGTKTAVRSAFLKPVDDVMRATPSKLPSIKPAKVGEIVNKYRAQLSNIDPRYETVLKSQPTPDKVMAYFDQAEKAAVDPASPMATKLASDRAIEAFDKIEAGLNETGRLKGELLDTIADKPIVSNIPGNSIDNVKNTIKERYGLEVDNQGNLVEVPGRMASIDANSKKLISEYVTLLRQLGPKPTARKLDDFVDKTQRMLYKQGASQNVLEVADTPVVAFLKQQTGEINTQLKKQVDEALKARGETRSYSELNDEYASLIEISTTLNKKLGLEGDKGAALMKSLFSAQTGEPTRRLFQQIKDRTGIDLFEEATLAKFAMESVGDNRSKTLLQQIDQAAKEAGRVNLMEPGSWLDYIREKADLDGRQLAEEIIKQSNASQTGQ